MAAVVRSKGVGDAALIIAYPHGMKLLNALAVTLAVSFPGCITLFDADLPAPPDACVTCDMSCEVSEETCNGHDDDCDGRIDEDASEWCGEPMGGRAVCGAGVCAVVCDVDRHDIDGIFENGCEYVCTAGADGVEVCDGADDDCDGIADEGLMGDIVPGLRGVCSGARRTCQGRSGWGEPRFDVIDAFEVEESTCDGRDNDCDGTIDEGQPVAERCTRCNGESGPPCNGCPREVVVPGGWVCIPAGSFAMGSPSDEVWHQDDEGPVQPVRITRPFLMMATEVKQSEWVALTGINPSRETMALGNACDLERPGECPVERVSWYDAIWYANAVSRALGLPPCYDEASLLRCIGTPGSGCMGDEVACADDTFTCDDGANFDSVALDCRGARLPTEAEWEYAARAGTAGLFWFPSERFGEIDALEWIDQFGRANRSNPVGRLAPNPWGLFDMLGNVHEWVQDTYRSYPDPAPPAEMPHLDRLPLQEDAEPQRSYRGGSWLHVGEAVRAAIRWKQEAERRDAFIGLRLVRSIDRSEE